MRVIAFDLGRNMAWAHNAGKRLEWGTKTFDGVRASRFRDMSMFVPLILAYSPPFDIVVYETPFARGRDATRSMWGFAGILEARATEANIAVLDVAVPTIKKFAAGNGHAPKDAMILAAKKFGYKGSNDNEADAICLLKYAEANLEYGEK